MRGIMAAILALSVLAVAAGKAYAVDQFPQDFWDEQERNLP